MSYTRTLIERYLGRTGQPRANEKDTAYAYQWSVLRDLMERLEVILDDEGVPRETAKRVLRCLAYGAPSAADADLRMEQDARINRPAGPRAARTAVYARRHRAAAAVTGSDAFGKLLRGIIGPPDAQPGPPYTHTLTHPETEEEIAAEPALPAFTVERDPAETPAAFQARLTELVGRGDITVNTARRALGFPAWPPDPPAS